jgi:hypothetical protein
MISVINTVEGLQEKKSFIDTLFNDFGEIYLQEYRSLQADFYTKKNSDYFVFVNEENRLITAFEKKSENTWQCTISAYPVLCEKMTSKTMLIDFFDEIKKELGITTLYFPLVYEKCELFKVLRNLPQFSFWSRLPCPIINGDLSPNLIWNRVLERYGSRANRQKKRFESKLVVKLIEMNDLEAIVEKVETNSWKRLFSQDMLSRGNQFLYYTNIIKSGLADITVAFDEETGEAVAFRIDSMVNGVLYVIKWSYDESYKQYSPGFYLLTVELFKKYSGKKLNFIDLYGSPDMLKNQIETGRVERFDMGYSTNKVEVESIKAERTTFDNKIFNNYQNQQSVKKIFNN